MLNPVIPAFETPTMKAPSAANIHSERSFITRLLPHSAGGRRRARQSVVYVELAQLMEVDDDVITLAFGQFRSGREFITRVQVGNVGMQVVHCALEHFAGHPLG